MKYSIFYERILQFAESQGFKNISDFAKRGLGWISSEKLNRLKREDNKPSVDMCIEISNKFPDFNIHWWLTGTGEITEKKSQVNEYAPKYQSKNDDLRDKMITLLEEKVQYLMTENENLKNERKTYQRS